MVNFFGKAKKEIKKEVVTTTASSYTNKEFIITLFGINLNKIENEYGKIFKKKKGLSPYVPSSIPPVMAYKSFINDNKDKVTALEHIGISELHVEPMVTVLHHNQIKTYITMMDYTLNQKIPLQTNIPCNCCHRSFSTCPIGIPVKKLGNIFYIDGIYCSFNCAINIIETDHDPLHTESTALLNLMYLSIFGEFPKQRIIASPGWRSRILYGGWLTDEEFEKTLQIITFKNINQLKNLTQTMKPLGRIFEVRE